MKESRGSIFASQQNEDLQYESKVFYDAQDKYIKKHNIKYNKSKHYISKEYLHRIVTVMQKLFKQKKANKNVEWLFSKSMDIMIRQNITDKSFIRYNQEVKGCFYSNAMYRVYNFGLNSFNSKYSAFNYFTTTIRTSFVEEINDFNKQLLTAKKMQIQTGLSSSISNIEKNNLTELEKDYGIDYDTIKKENIPMFINDIIQKFGKLTTKEIVLNPNEPRFKRKKAVYDYYLKVISEKRDENDLIIQDEKGIMIKYIDIYKFNENTGQTKTVLQNEIKIARENGHQTFYIFSDVYLDENISEEMLFGKLEKMIEYIKTGEENADGTQLMFNYIPTNYMKVYTITEPNWFYLNPKREKRELTLKQDIEYYMELKEKEPDCTRTFDAGTLNLNSFK